MNQYPLTERVNETREKMQELPTKKMDMSEVPQERQEKMIEYAKMLRRKFPTMKKERIMKKVAAYFKIKLV